MLYPTPHTQNPSPSPFFLAHPEHQPRGGEGQRDEHEEAAREHPAVARVAAELRGERVDGLRRRGGRGRARADVEARDRAERQEGRSREETFDYSVHLPEPSF